MAVAERVAGEVMGGSVVSFFPFSRSPQRPAEAPLGDTHPPIRGCVGAAPPGGRATLRRP
jgi:hypothetical protein